MTWSRLYSLEPRLPGGHAGGVLGYLVGPLAVKWLGFAGSGLVAIALGVVGAALAFRFSWGQAQSTEAASQARASTLSNRWMRARRSAMVSLAWMMS